MSALEKQISDWAAITEDKSDIYHANREPNVLKAVKFVNEYAKAKGLVFKVNADDAKNKTFEDIDSAIAAADDSKSLFKDIREKVMDDPETFDLEFDDDSDWSDEGYGPWYEVNDGSLENTVEYALEFLTDNCYFELVEKYEAYMKDVEANKISDFSEWLEDNGYEYIASNQEIEKEEKSKYNYVGSFGVYFAEK